MESANDSDKKPQGGEQESLPLRKIDSAPTPEEPLESPTKTHIIQKNITREPSENTSNDNERKELGDFERLTLRWARLNAVFVGFTLIAIVGTAVVFWGQFKEMAAQTDILGISARQARRDSAEASITSGKQIAIAQQQAKAAQDSVKAIQRQMRQDQRPWIKFQMGDPKVSRTVSWEVQIGESLKAPVRFANIGKTPAVNPEIFVMVDIIPRGEDPKLPIRFRDAKRTSRHAAAVTKIQTGTIFPNSDVHDMVERLELANGVIKRKPISLAEAQEVAQQNAYLVIFGIARYFDGFGIQHWTKFCRGGFANGDDANSGKCAKL